MGFVYDQVPPVKLLEDGPFDDEHLVRRDAHVPLAGQQGVPNEGRL